MKNIDFVKMYSAYSSYDKANIVEKTYNHANKAILIDDNFPEDIIDIKYPNNKLLTASNTEKINFAYENNSIAVTVVRDGIEHKIKPENLPSELRQISNIEQFNKFLDNAYVNVKSLNGGDIKVDINQKLRGGGQYKIQKNDNYWNLESKYGWSHGTLKTLNPHIDPIKLQIGSLINIPSSSSSSSKSSAVAYKKPVSSLMSSKPVFEESKTPFGGGFSDSFGFHKTPFSTHKPFDPFGSGFSTPSYPSTVHKPIFTAKAPVHKSESLFYKELGARESSDNYEALNKLGYMGKYQMGTPALIDIGYKTKFGWTGKDGINNQKDFLNSSTVQEKAARAYHEVQWGYLKKVTTSEKTGKQKCNCLEYIGKKVAGIYISEAGLRAAAHNGGARPVGDFLISGGEIDEPDGNGRTISDNLKHFAPYSYDK